MRQFDVYENPSPATRRAVPYVLVLQSHFLDSIPTVIVAPVIPEEVRPPYDRTSVRIDVGGRTLFAFISEMAAIDRRRLVGPVSNALAFEDEIRRALDLVFVGV